MKEIIVKIDSINLEIINDFCEGEGGEQPVELIRCEDCIYWKRYCRVVDGVTSHHVCGRKRELDGTMYRSKANDFCSGAEKKR